MAKYIANENGDWWEVVEGDSLYLIDTEWENINNKMEEENTDIQDSDDGIQWLPSKKGKT